MHRKVTWAHREKAAPISPEKKPQNEIYLGVTLILDFSASRIVRHKFLLLSHPVWGVFLGQPKLTHIGSE